MGLEVEALERGRHVPEGRVQGPRLAGRRRAPNGPGSAREDLHIEVELYTARSLSLRSRPVLLVFHRRAEPRHDVARGADVLEHGLDVAGELVAALRLQAGDDAALQVFRHWAAPEEPLGQVLLEVALENVFVLQMAEEEHDPVDEVLDLVLRDILEAAAQLVVEELGEALRGGRLEVHEGLEALLNGGGKDFAAVESLGHHPVELGLECEEALHVGNCAERALGLLHQAGSALLEALLEAGAQSLDAPRDAPQQPVQEPHGVSVPLL